MQHLIEQAVASMQSKGYIPEEVLTKLSPDEYQLVMQRVTGDAS